MLAISFPKPSSMLRQAFKELDTLAYGSDAEKAALGDPQALARPWDPSSVVNPRLRQQLWEWLDRVVVWVNHEYGWRPEDLIPECWPQHPALVREIAVLADLRRRAGAAATSRAGSGGSSGSTSPAGTAATSAANTSRSVTSPNAPATENSCFAKAAPTCTLTLWSSSARGLPMPSPPG